MSQQNKSESRVAALEAKIAEQQLHIEVLASNMFAQKQRADELQKALGDTEQELENQQQANVFVSGDMHERHQLLQAAATKPVRAFTQFDYFNEDTGVCGGPDRDYDVFMGRTKEFNRSGCVRLLIPDNYSTQDARRALIQFLELVDDGQIENMRRPTRNARDLFDGEESPFLRDLPGWVADDIDDENEAAEMHTPPVMSAFRAHFFNRPLTPAEAQAIEAEMGRIELAAETENARFDAMYEAVEQLIVMESSCPVYSPLDADPIPLRWWVQFGKHTGTTAKELADEWDHLVAEAMAEEYRIDYELNSVLETTVHNEAPKVSAKVDVIFDEEEAALGYPCFRVNVENGGAANYSIKVDENGQPHLQETWRDDEPYTGEVPF